jgi:hypothetical protein
MSELKTKPNRESVETFLNSIDNEQKRNDAYTLLSLMKDISGEKPLIWGESIIGFGTYHYKYESGREGDWFLTGFSPRKNNFSIYIMPGFGKYDRLMDKLGKHKTGKSCLYINRLSDIDIEVLNQLIRESLKYMKQKYG